MADGDIRVDRPKRPAVPPAPDDGSNAGLRAELEAEAGESHDRDVEILSSEPSAMLVKDEPPVPGAGDMGIPKGKRRRGDRIFLALTSGSSAFVIIIVLLIAAFLLIKAVPSIIDDKSNFLFSNDWSTVKSDLRFGIAGLLYTTLLISLFALLIAVPIAIGIALFITQYAHPRIARPLAYVVDLLAAIPSIIYGVWGAFVLSAHLTAVQNLLTHLSWFPLFRAGADTKTVFDGGVVLAVMILPIITAISRDVFDRTPTANKEAALALGATRWEMIRMAVLPYGRPGVVSGAMLGLGRALGETIAVYLVVAKVSKFDWSLFSGGETFASKIVGSSDGFGQNPGPYVAAGLALFVLTFLVNGAARAIVNRRKDFR